MKAWTHIMEPRPALLFLLLTITPQLGYAAPLENSDESTEIEYYPVADSTGCYYNFEHYDEGDRIITNEPCLNCTCHNRMLMCYLRVCPFTKAIGQDCKMEKKEDQCCPVITCPEVPVQLLPHASTTPSTEVGHLNEYGCSIDNLFYADGAKVPSNPSNPCEVCYCIRNKTACIIQECTLTGKVVQGCRPVYVDGVCCPARYDCDHPQIETTPRPLLTTTTTTLPPTSAPTDCIYNNEVYADGALVKKDVPCEQCYCMKGDIVCAVQECGPTPLDKVNCTALPPKEDQCCPDTYECDNLSEEDLTTLAYLSSTTQPSDISQELSTVSVEKEETIPTTEVSAPEISEKVSVSATETIAEDHTEQAETSTIEAYTSKITEAVEAVTSRVTELIEAFTSQVSEKEETTREPEIITEVEKVEESTSVHPIIVDTTRPITEQTTEQITEKGHITIVEAQEVITESLIKEPITVAPLSQEKDTETPVDSTAESEYIPTTETTSFHKTEEQTEEEEILVEPTESIAHDDHEEIEHDELPHEEEPEVTERPEKEHFVTEQPEIYEKEPEATEYPEEKVTTTIYSEIEGKQTAKYPSTATETTQQVESEITTVSEAETSKANVTTESYIEPEKSSTVVEEIEEGVTATTEAVITQTVEDQKEFEIAKEPCTSAECVPALSESESSHTEADISEESIYTTTQSIPSEKTTEGVEAETQANKDQELHTTLSGEEKETTVSEEKHPEPTKLPSSTEISVTKESETELPKEEISTETVIAGTEQQEKVAATEIPEIVKGTVEPDTSLETGKEQVTTEGAGEEISYVTEIPTKEIEKPQSMDHIAETEAPTVAPEQESTEESHFTEIPTKEIEKPESIDHVAETEAPTVAPEQESTEDGKQRPLDVTTQRAEEEISETVTKAKPVATEESPSDTSEETAQLPEKESLPCDDKLGCTPQQEEDNEIPAIVEVCTKDSCTPQSQLPVSESDKETNVIPEGSVHCDSEQNCVPSPDQQGTGESNKIPEGEVSGGCQNKQDCVPVVPEKEDKLPEIFAEGCTDKEACATNIPETEKEVVPDTNAVPESPISAVTKPSLERCEPGSDCGNTEETITEGEEITKLPESSTDISNIPDKTLADDEEPEEEILEPLPTTSAHGLIETETATQTQSPELDKQTEITSESEKKPATENEVDLETTISPKYDTTHIPEISQVTESQEKKSQTEYFVTTSSPAEVTHPELDQQEIVTEKVEEPKQTETEGTELPDTFPSGTEHPETTSIPEQVVPEGTSSPGELVTKLVEEITNAAEINTSPPERETTMATEKEIENEIIPQVPESTIIPEITESQTTATETLEQQTDITEVPKETHSESIQVAEQTTFVPDTSKKEEVTEVTAETPTSSTQAAIGIETSEVPQVTEQNIPEEITTEKHIPTEQISIKEPEVTEQNIPVEITTEKHIPTEQVSINEPEVTEQNIPVEITTEKHIPTEQVAIKKPEVTEENIPEEITTEKHIATEQVPIKEPEGTDVPELIPEVTQISEKISDITQAPQEQIPFGTETSVKPEETATDISIPGDLHVTKAATTETDSVTDEINAENTETTEQPVTEGIITVPSETRAPESIASESTESPATTYPEGTQASPIGITDLIHSTVSPNETITEISSIPEKNISEGILEETTTSGLQHTEITQAPEQEVTEAVAQEISTETQEEEHGIPGEGNCLVDGQTYKNNSIVPPINQCQTSCRCVSSILQCESIACTPPPSNMQNCTPIFLSVDNCCPTYSCSTTGVTSMESESHVVETTTARQEEEKPVTIGIQIIPSEEVTSVSETSTDIKSSEEITTTKPLLEGTHTSIPEIEEKHIDQTTRTPTSVSVTEQEITEKAPEHEIITLVTETTSNASVTMKPEDTLNEILPEQDETENELSEEHGIPERCETSDCTPQEPVTDLNVIPIETQKHVTESDKKGETATKTPEEIITEAVTQVSGIVQSSPTELETTKPTLSEDEISQSTEETATDKLPIPEQVVPIHKEPELEQKPETLTETESPQETVTVVPEISENEILQTDEKQTVSEFVTESIASEEPTEPVTQKTQDSLSTDQIIEKVTVTSSYEKEQTISGETTKTPEEIAAMPDMEEAATSPSIIPEFSTEEFTTETAFKASEGITTSSEKDQTTEILPGSVVSEHTTHEDGLSGTAEPQPSTEQEETELHATFDESAPEISEPEVVTEEEPTIKPEKTEAVAVTEIHEAATVQPEVATESHETEIKPETEQQEVVTPTHDVDIEPETILPEVVTELHEVEVKPETESPEVIAETQEPIVKPEQEIVTEPQETKPETEIKPETEKPQAITESEESEITSATSQPETITESQESEIKAGTERPEVISKTQKPDVESETLQTEVVTEPQETGIKPETEVPEVISEPDVEPETSRPESITEPQETEIKPVTSQTESVTKPELSETKPETEEPEVTKTQETGVEAESPLAEVVTETQKPEIETEIVPLEDTTKQQGLEGQPETVQVEIVTEPGKPAEESEILHSETATESEHPEVEPEAVTKSHETETKYEGVTELEQTHVTPETVYPTEETSKPQEAEIKPETELPVISEAQVPEVTPETVQPEATTESQEPESKPETVPPETVTELEPEVKPELVSTVVPIVKEEEAATGQPEIKHTPAEPSSKPLETAAHVTEVHPLEEFSSISPELIPEITTHKPDEEITVKQTEETVTLKEVEEVVTEHIPVRGSVPEEEKTVKPEIILSTSDKPGKPIELEKTQTTVTESSDKYDTTRPSVAGEVTLMKEGEYSTQVPEEKVTVHVPEITDKVDKVEVTVTSIEPELPETSTESLLTENVTAETVKPETVGPEKIDEDTYTSPQISTVGPINVTTELYTSGPAMEISTKKTVAGELSTSLPLSTTISTTVPSTAAPTYPTPPVPGHDIPGEQVPELPDYQSPVEDYEDEDQSPLGPGTCRYGGKVYVSAQQIPRDDPCDFCFCFRSDIICLQQSCPPPIPRCHEEPIRGFCCPRYECPVGMATAVNLTTSTTTTTTTLPPHFLSHAYKGRATRSGCQIEGRAYQVGDVIKSASGPCLHCTCGGNGQMKCDPKACSPEPMLRQMIAAATSRRRR